MSKSVKTSDKQSVDDTNTLKFVIPHSLGGQPTKYRKEYCEEVIKLGAAGKSMAQMAVHLNVDRITLRNWSKVHDEFFTALSRAKELSQAWWEEAGQRGLDMQGFNAGLYNKIVSARFRDDYGDRTETTVRTSDDAAEGEFIDVRSLGAEERAMLKQILAPTSEYADVEEGNVIDTIDYVVEDEEDES
jgi:hypothetical protein